MRENRRSASPCPCAPGGIPANLVGCIGRQGFTAPCSWRLFACRAGSTNRESAHSGGSSSYRSVRAFWRRFLWSLRSVFSQIAIEYGLSGNSRTLQFHLPLNAENIGRYCVEIKIQILHPHPFSIALPLAVFHSRGARKRRVDASARWPFTVMRIKIGASPSLLSLVLRM